MIGVFSKNQKPKIFVSKFICTRTQVTKTLVTQSNKSWTNLHLQSIENDLNFLRAVFHK